MAGSSRSSQVSNATVIVVIVLALLASANPEPFKNLVDTLTGAVSTKIAQADTPSITVRTELPAIPSVAGLPIAERTSIAGYQRGCGAGQACSFGPAWNDNTNAPGGHNGCDTRNDVLASQLTNVTYRTGSRCVVVSGTLEDPYTGKTIAFTKDAASAVQIDHVIPLAYAWDMGASGWTQDKRNEFANDLSVNLLAVGGTANTSKSDKGPGSWMPPNTGFACTYGQRWVAVATKYGLRVAPADAAALSKALASCVVPG